MRLPSLPYLGMGCAIICLCALPLFVVPYAIFAAKIVWWGVVLGTVIYYILIFVSMSYIVIRDTKKDGEA